MSTTRKIDLGPLKACVDLVSELQDSGWQIEESDSSVLRARRVGGTFQDLEALRALKEAYLHVDLTAAIGDHTMRLTDDAAAGLTVATLPSLQPSQLFDDDLEPIARRVWDGDA